MLVVGSVVVLLLACFAGLFWMLASRFDVQQCTSEWLDTFSLERYAPMERLLQKDDLAFLSAQTGYRPEIGKRLMTERRKIFRAYLRLLVRDFNQLMAIGRLMVVYSAQDQQEFARSLGRQQVRFYGRVCLLQVQLVIYPVAGNALDTGGLLDALGSMQTRVKQLTSAGPPSTQLA